MRENRFQVDITTGRLTLPVVILFCLIIWGTGSSSWSDLGTLGIVAFSGYLMIEMNTAFTLIRTRTTFPVCIYWYVISIFFFLHPFTWSNFVQLAFLLSVFQLFFSYECSHAQTHIFHAFLFIGLGSLLFPQLIYFSPLFAFSMITFRALSAKSFFASLLGLSIPYWFLFGYAFYFDEMHLFYAPVNEMLHFYSIDYTLLLPQEVLSEIFILFLLIISSLHYFQVAYMDKTKTRIYLSFLVFAGWWTTLFVVLQPQHLHQLLPIQCICTAFLSGHLFTLTRNRFSSYLFVVTFVIVMFLTLYHLWMQLFSL